jgi:hypothetical protein
MRVRGRELVDIDEVVAGKEVKSAVSQIWPRMVVEDMMEEEVVTEKEGEGSRVILDIPRRGRRCRRQGASMARL